MTVYNAIQCLNCKDILWSKHRHDYIVCKCGSCMNDGGNEYRRGYVGQPEKNLSVTTNDPFEKVREYLHRYNIYSKSYVKLKNISDEWLQNIIDYHIEIKNICNNPGFQMFLTEKLYRAENEIFVPEDSNYELDYGG